MGGVPDWMTHCPRIRGRRRTSRSERPTARRSLSVVGDGNRMSCLTRRHRAASRSRRGAESNGAMRAHAEPIACERHGVGRHAGNASAAATPSDGTACPLVDERKHARGDRPASLIRHVVSDAGEAAATSRRTAVAASAVAGIPDQARSRSRETRASAYAPALRGQALGRRVGEQDDISRAPDRVDERLIGLRAGVAIAR